MKLNTIASALAVARFVTGSAEALASPGYAQDTGTDNGKTLTKNVIHDKTSKAHKGGKRNDPKTAGGYG
jgi:hypothetical protein